MLPMLTLIKLKHSAINNKVGGFMFNKKFFGTFAALIIGGNFFIAPPASAEIKTYTGEGEYLMNDFETPDIAKQRAKLRAEQNAQEQAGFFLESYSHMKNFDLLDDEIFTISAGIMKVYDVNYQQDFVADGQGILIHVTLKADIDSDNMDKWLTKSIEERRKINSQLENLREENLKQEKVIADLKSQLAAGTVSREQAVQDFQQQDKIFLFNQKLEEGWKFYSDENFQAAVQTFTDAINISPRNAEGYFGRGTAYNCLNENQKAVADFDKSIDIAPNFYAYNNRGKANFELNNYSAALEDFNKALQVNSQDFIAYINRGKIYFALRRIEQGMEDFNKAVALQPNNFLPYVQRAAAFYALGNFNDALQDLNKSIKLNPNNYEAYSYRAEVYCDLKNFKEALKNFNKAIDLNPNDGETFYLRGKCYEILGDTKNARADFAAAKKLGYKE